MYKEKMHKASQGIRFDHFSNKLCKERENVCTNLEISFNIELNCISKIYIQKITILGMLWGYYKQGKAWKEKYYIWVDT